jgi:hypothetical protein
MELRSTVSSAGLLYLPATVREGLGKRVRLLPDSLAVVVFPEKADLTDVRDSLRIVLQDVELRIRTAERGVSGEPTEKNAHETRE